MTVSEANQWWLFFNSGLIVLSGTVSVLFQRRLEAQAKQREQERVEHAKDLAAGLADNLEKSQQTSDCCEETQRVIQERLDAVITQRNHLAEQHDNVLKEIRDDQKVIRGIVEKLK